MNSDLKEPYKRAIKRIGSLDKAAKGLGYKTAYGLGKFKGIVPSEHVLNFCALAEWVSTPHEIRSDLYPHPDDGLPEHLRGRAEAMASQQ